MRAFVVPDFENIRYENTLFSQLCVVDDRNPEIIKQNPATPEDRLMAFRMSPISSFHLMSKLDGSPDYRYKDNIFSIGGEQWTSLSALLSELEKAQALGDILSHGRKSAIPVMPSKWPLGEKNLNAAVLTSTPGWALPVYFENGFADFTLAVERLRQLVLEIAAKTAPSVDVQS